MFYHYRTFLDCLLSQIPFLPGMTVCRYNPENSNESRLLRHRACELQDMAHSFMDHELSEDFEKLCHDLKESAQRVGIHSPVFHPTIPQRSSHRKSHGDEFSNLSDDDEMALYRRRSLRQQGVEPQVEGIPYYGPRRARKRAAIDEDEDDDEVTDNGWKSGESFDNERNSSKDTDKEKSDPAVSGFVCTVRACVDLYVILLTLLAILTTIPSLLGFSMK